MSALSSEGRTVRLRVRSHDPATEIFVIDGQFRLADRGVGRLDSKLAPGIYVVKARIGNEVHEEDVILTPDERGIHTVTLPPMTVSSSAPLNSSAYSHEFHREAATKIARAKPQVHAGEGSQIFIQSREFTSRQRPDGEQPPSPDPSAGLTLRDADGTVVVDLARDAKRDLGWDPWAACTAEVSPGSYRLCLDLPSGDRVEQTLVASEGWQTQVYLLQRTVGSSSDERRADLSGASIFLTRRHGGAPRSESQARLTELARLGLAERRTILSAELRNMLRDKFRDPMLGLYGGHLLLLEKEPDLGLLSIVVENLRSLVGRHPDVEALALRLPGQTPSYTFVTPPMLRRSWALIVEATIDHPAIVPPGSFAATIADRIWAEEPWLIWSSPPGSRATKASRSRSAERRQQQELVDRVDQIVHETSRGARGKPAPSRRSRPPAFASAMLQGSGGSVSPAGTDDDILGVLVRTLGLPRAVVEELMLKSQ